MDSSLYKYYVIDRAHHGNRIRCHEALGEQYRALELSDVERMTRRFEYLTSLEVPHIHPHEQIAMVRTVANLPDVYTEEEWTDIKKEHYVHELGYVSNLSPNYEDVIAHGLLACRETADEYGRRAIDNIIDLIATNLLARLWREGAANTCVEELQIVIYFGCCTYRRAGVARDDLLLDSNGWGDTLDKVDIGLFDTAKKLTGIRREALDIAALTLGKDGVEGKGRFTRARKTCDNGQCIVRDGEIDVFQIVNPRSPDVYGLVL